MEDAIEVKIQKEPDLPVVDFIQSSSKIKKRNINTQSKKKSKKQKLPEKDTKETTDPSEELPSEGPKIGFTSALETILSKPIEFEVPILPFETEVDKLARENKKTQKIQKNKKDQQKLLLDKDHMKLTSDIENWEEEKRLKKIATKGVVQLFNAVSQHQKKIKKEKNKDKHKKELTKEKFLELLQKDNQPTPKTPQMEIENENKPSKWEVLSDDYLMGLKGWKDDNEDSEDGNDSSENERNQNDQDDSK